MTPRRHVASLGTAVSVWLGVVASCNVLPAQVGHPPSSSPYRDIPRGRGPVLTGGYFTGEGGQLDVGITNAITLGIRYDIPLGGSMRFGVGMFYGLGERFLIDPTDSAATRKTGPVDDDFLLAEAEIQLLLTGNKTWHGFAPYVSAGGGFVVGGAEPAADTSDYRLGTKFFFAPGAGVRWYPTRRLNLQLDARLVNQKLSYPPQYFDLGLDKESEWARHPWFRVGLGWTF
jgi:hypothetical protein